MSTILKKSKTKAEVSRVQRLDVSVCAGGQMAFTARGRKLSLRWGFLCNRDLDAAMNSPGRVGSAAIPLAFLCKKLWANGGRVQPSSVYWGRRGFVEALMSSPHCPRMRRGGCSVLQSRVWGVHRWPNIIFNIKGWLCYVLFMVQKLYSHLSNLWHIFITQSEHNKIILYGFDNDRFYDLILSNLLHNNN